MFSFGFLLKFQSLQWTCIMAIKGKFLKYRLFGAYFRRTLCLGWITQRSACFPEAGQTSASFVFIKQKKLVLFPKNILVDQVSKNLREESTHFSSLQFHRRKRTGREKNKTKQKKTNSNKTRMETDFQSSASFSGSLSKIKDTVLSITQRSYKTDEKSKASFFPLCALDMRVSLSKYICQVPGTEQQLTNKMNKTQLPGSGWNCYLLLQDRIKRWTWIVRGVASPVLSAVVQSLL